MFGTQVSAICNDETGIEALKKEEAKWEKKSRWKSLQVVQPTLMLSTILQCLTAGRVRPVLPLLVLPLLLHPAARQATRLPHLSLAAATAHNIITSAAPILTDSVISIICYLTLSSLQK